MEQGLAKLVLSLIELALRLMEKQALRRMAAGSLIDDEIERMGETFMRRERKMDELKATFGLQDGDLNLNFGPLKDLLEESYVGGRLARGYRRWWSGVRRQRSADE